MTNKKEQSLLTFPCDFPLKVFGLATESFAPTVLTIIQKYVPTVTAEDLHSRDSGNGKYVSLSITLHVESKAQLDGLYQALTASPLVLMTL